MRALLLAAALLPTGWTHVRTGPDGGAVWIGRIPNQVVTWDRRPSAVYLSPDFDPTRRYPVVYLLHGMRGMGGVWEDYLVEDVVPWVDASPADAARRPQPRARGP